METVLMRKLGQTKGVAITSLDEGDAIVENREPISIDSRQAADKCAYPFVCYPFFFRAVSRLKNGNAPVVSRTHSTTFAMPSETLPCSNSRLM